MDLQLSKGSYRFSIRILHKKSNPYGRFFEILGN
jgi:hypothetical protein